MWSHRILPRSTEWDPIDASYRTAGEPVRRKTSRRVELMTKHATATHRRIKGGCLCGAVAFEVVNSFERIFLCSCRQCRQITGSAFASNLSVDPQGFDWLGGAENIVNYKVPGRDISKSFCRVCGSGVPWTSGDGTKMIVPAGSLSEPVNVVERTRIFASEQPAWASDLEHVPVHARFPETSRSEPTDESPAPPGNGSLSNR